MPRVLLLAFTILFASILGCGGPEKELPKDIATAKGREKEIEPASPIPTSSQPDAVKLVEKCLAAATEGHKERLEKLKANRLSEQGTMLRDMRHVPTTRKIAAVWPDRYFYSNESTGADPLNISIGLRLGSLTFRQNDAPFDPGLPKGYEQILTVDSVGLHWLPTLFTLTDAKTIVFGARKQTLGTKSWDTVQVVVPSCPVFTLWFDDNTGLLGFVTFLHAEGAAPIEKRLAVSGHKPFAGVQLPTRYEFERNGVTVETWTVSLWEFPDRIDDAVFDQKK